MSLTNEKKIIISLIIKYNFANGCQIEKKEKEASQQLFWGRRNVTQLFIKQKVQKNKWDKRSAMSFLCLMRAYLFFA